MFWIHGGGFTTGSSNSVIYGPEYLITEDVVLVTFNYRLGVLGIPFTIFYTTVFVVIKSDNNFRIFKSGR